MLQDSRPVSLSQASILSSSILQLLLRDPERLPGESEGVARPPRGLRQDGRACNTFQERRPDLMPEPPTAKSKGAHTENVNIREGLSPTDSDSFPFVLCSVRQKKQ